jgi:hypothetical protein
MELEETYAMRSHDPDALLMAVGVGLAGLA